MITRETEFGNECHLVGRWLTGAIMAPAFGFAALAILLVAEVVVTAEARGQVLAQWEFAKVLVSAGAAVLGGIIGASFEMTPALLRYAKTMHNRATLPVSFAILVSMVSLIGVDHLTDGWVAIAAAWMIFAFVMPAVIIGACWMTERKSSAKMSDEI